MSIIKKEYIGCKLEAEKAKKFNELSAKRGINKSFVIRELVTGWLEKLEKSQEIKNSCSV